MYARRLLYVVMFQELSHNVPKSARKEFELATKAELRDEINAAIEHLSKAMELDPEFWAALNDLGVNFIRAKHVEQGVEWLQRAVNIDGFHRPAAKIDD
jgi:tetratricopeptide (TPR) repeat protein